MSNEFITTDAEIIFDEIISMLEAGVDEPLYPGDERRIFGEAIVPLFVAMYNSVNDACRQKMLRYARGEVLDDLGERAGVYRIPSSEATTVLRFSMHEAVGENVIIPQGTRATSDNTRYFETVDAAVIEAGELFVEVEAVSIGGGTQYNNIPEGFVNTLVDLLPYVDTVSNIVATDGGADEEDDDNLRERIRVAPTQKSTAGSVNGYRYWAMSADASIIDVKVKSEQETISRTLEVNGNKAYKGGRDLIASTLIVYLPDGVTPATIDTDYVATYDDDLLTIELKANGSLSAVAAINIEIEKTNEGIVKIVPICEDGELPNEAIIEKVFETCNASEVRPITDIVKVEPPHVIEYDIDLTYYTTASEEGICIQTVEGEGGAIDQYNSWQCSELGRHINPDKLRALILAPTEEGSAGATRVVINSPEFTQLNDTTIARFSGKKTIRHEVST